MRNDFGMRGGPLPGHHARRKFDVLVQSLGLSLVALRLTILHAFLSSRAGDLHDTIIIIENYMTLPLFQQDSRGAAQSSCKGKTYDTE